MSDDERAREPESAADDGRAAGDAGTLEDERPSDDEEGSGGGDDRDDDPELMALLRAAARTPRFLTGTRLGRFKVGAVLGKGGMGTVYAAFDDVLEREVALKVLHDDDAGRVLAEARASAALRHEHICTLYDTVEIEGLRTLALERLHGETLRTRLVRGALDEEQALVVARDVALALAHAHAAGFVHRDLKPENVMVDERGRAKLLDFGIARPEGLGDAPLAGTRGYIAPEAADGVVDPRADVYAFGVTLDEMCLVFAHRPSTRSDALRALAARCRAPDRTARPPDGAALVRALDEIAARADAPRRISTPAGPALAALMALALIGAAMVARTAFDDDAPEVESVPRTGVDRAVDLRFRAAVFALYAGDVEAARTALDEVRAAGATSPGPRLVEAALRVLEGRTDAAAALVEDAARDDPDAVMEGYVARAVRAAAGALDGATPRADAEDLRREGAALLDARAGDFFAELMIALVLPLGADPTTRARALDELAMRAPRVALLALLRAGTAMRLHDDAAARATLEEARARIPGNPFLDLALADLVVAREPGRARALVEGVLERRPYDARARVVGIEAALLLDEPGAVAAVDALLDAPLAPLERARGAALLALLVSGRGEPVAAARIVERAARELVRHGGAALVPAVAVVVADDARDLGVGEERARMRALLDEQAASSPGASASLIDAARYTLAAVDALDDGDDAGFRRSRAALEALSPEGFRLSLEKERTLAVLDGRARARAGERYGFDLIARTRATLPPDHVLFTRLAVDELRALEPHDLARAIELGRAVVDARASCATRALFWDLGCRAATAWAATFLDAHGAPLDDEARREVLALFSGGAKTPTLDALRARVR